MLTTTIEFSKDKIMPSKISFAKCGLNFIYQSIFMTYDIIGSKLSKLWLDTQTKPTNRKVVEYFLLLLYFLAMKLISIPESLKCPCILYTPICSTTGRCTWFGSRIKPCSFNLSLCQETKDKGQNDWNSRGKYLKKGDNHLLKLLIMMYMLNPSCSVVYLSQVHG